LAIKQSFTGDLANPIVQARIEVAISANVLARRLGFSKQYLSRVEQGTYSSLNPALLRWAANALNWSPDKVVQRYVQFQKATRRATIDRIEPAPLMRYSSDPGNVIFERWRAGYWLSPTAFATEFCIHPDLIQKYEEGITKTMPKQLKAALIENGMLDSNWKDDLFLPQKSKPQTAV
jgi:transcriptional regulator with XRE-family HTH domain